MIINMSLNDEPFEKITNGDKTIELRLYDNKRSRLNIGDYIIFKNLLNGKEIAIKIRALYRYATFKDLFSEIPLYKCGFDENTSIDIAVKRMRNIYTAEDEMSRGVLGIGMEPANLNDVIKQQKIEEQQIYDRYFPDGMK